MVKKWVSLLMVVILYKHILKLTIKLWDKNNSLLENVTLDHCKTCKHVLLSQVKKKQTHFSGFSIVLKVFLCCARAFVRTVRGKKAEAWMRVIYSECVAYCYCLFPLSFIIFHSLEWYIYMYFSLTLFFLSAECKGEAYSFALSISNLKI